MFLLDLPSLTWLTPPLVGSKAVWQSGAHYDKHGAEVSSLPSKLPKPGKDSWSEDGPKNMKGYEAATGSVKLGNPKLQLDVALYVCNTNTYF